MRCFEERIQRGGGDPKENTGGEGLGQGRSEFLAHVIQATKPGISGRAQELLLLWRAFLAGFTPALLEQEKEYERGCDEVQPTNSPTIMLQLKTDPVGCIGHRG